MASTVAIAPAQVNPAPAVVMPCARPLTPVLASLQLATELKRLVSCPPGAYSSAVAVLRPSGDRAPPEGR